MKYVSSRKIKTEYIWKEIKDRLFLSICPAKEAAAVKGLLYEEIGPIALVPRVLLKRDNEETQSGSLARDAARELKVTPEEIISQAKKKRRKIVSYLYH